MAKAMKASDVEGKRNHKSGIRVKNSKKRKRRFRLTPSQILFTMATLLVFMGSGIGYVWSNFEGTQIGYEMGRMQKEELRLKELNKKLRLELATLRSPQYLEDRTRHLGLKEASPDQIIILP